MRKNHLLRRLLCAALSLCLLALLAVPVLAEAPAEAAQEPGLTPAEAVSMQAADQAVTALTESEEYLAMTAEQRLEAAGQTLRQLAEEDHIQADSIYYDQENGLVSFAYTCGVLGGVLLEPEEWSEAPGLPAADPQELLAALDDTLEVNASRTALIVYDFDDISTSNRFPYYQLMQQSWTSAGMSTALLVAPSVQGMKRLPATDLLVLSTHGTYYTYTYGRILRRAITAPVVILREESSWFKDLFYSLDLLSHRVIKINGHYCLMPSFFSHSYRNGYFSNTLVFSETCDFTGFDLYHDPALANAFLSAGAPTVIGFHSTVYTIYSRNVMWDTVNSLLRGCTARDALDHAIDIYGANDAIWHDSVSSIPSHVPPAFPVLMGDGSRRL